MSTASFCLVADASCDIPAAALQNPQLRILPVQVFVGDQHMVDRRDSVATREFYRDHLNSPTAVNGRSEPLSLDDMIKAFNLQLALQFDQALGVFVAGSRSLIFTRAKGALTRARIESLAIRLKAGKTQPLQADCVDSQALFAGYGAQVMDLLDLVGQGGDINAVIARQHVTVAQTYAYMAPGNVGYILERAALKGEKSVSALAGFAAKALSITPILSGHLGQTAPVGRKLGKLKAREAVVAMGRQFLERKLLVSKHICFSYSGELDDIASMDSFKTLQSDAAQKQVQVHLTQMSMTGSVNVGPQALVLGVLAQPHDAAEMLK